MIRFNLILPIFRSPCRVLLWFMVLPCNSSLDSSIQIDHYDMHSKRTQEDVELYWTWKAFDPVVDFPWIMSLVTGEWWRYQFKFTKPKPSIWKPVGTSPSFTLSRSRSASYCGEGKSRRSSGRTTATTKPSVPQFSVSGSFVRTSPWCWQTRRGPRHSIRIIIKILLSDSVFVKLNQDKPQTDCLGLTTPALVKSLLRLVLLCPANICLVMILCKQSYVTQWLL